MERLALFVALSVTVGLLWQTEVVQQPPTVAELEFELPPSLEQLLSEIPPGDRANILRQLKRAHDVPNKVRIIELEQLTEHHPFLFPTDQMYREVPQPEVPFQRR